MLTYLISPANSTYSNNYPWGFAANESDNFQLGNSTLYIWYSNGSLLSDSNLTKISGTSNQTNWTYTIPQDGNYSWNVFTYDAAGNAAFNSTNRIFVLDTIPPQIQFSSPTPGNNSYLSQNYIPVNISASDINFANVTVYLYNSSGALNASFTNYTENAFNSFMNLSQGVYFVNATAYDLAGNVNSTETRQITLDTTPPNASLVSVKLKFHTLHMVQQRKPAI